VILGSGDRRRWCRSMLWTTADLLEQTAAPGVAPSSGELLRRSTAARVKLGGATGQCEAERWRGGVVMRGEGEGVLDWERERLLL
jgi:hypothetical protein